MTKINSKSFTDLQEDEAKEFVLSLYDENKWIIYFRAGPPDIGGVIVDWQEHKMYIDDEGKEQFDEVWVTSDNSFIQVQDLTEDQARNALRLMLRNGRLQRDAMNSILQNEGDFENLPGISEMDDEEYEEYITDNIFHIKGNTTLN